MRSIAMTNTLARVDKFEVLAGIDVPPELRGIFAQTPLLSHEDPQTYCDLFRQLAHKVRPSDVVEWLWLKDVADLTWQKLRYRRLSDALLNLGRKQALASILRMLLEEDPIGWH